MSIRELKTTSLKKFKIIYFFEFLENKIKNKINNHRGKPSKIFCVC